MGGTPDIPPPPPPPAPPPVPTMDDARQKQQAQDQIAAKRGRAATILSQGTQAAGTGTSTSGKQLLGS